MSGWIFKLSTGPSVQLNQNIGLDSNPSFSSITASYATIANITTTNIIVEGTGPSYFDHLEAGSGTFDSLSAKTTQIQTGTYSHLSGSYLQTDNISISSGAFNALTGNTLITNTLQIFSGSFQSLKGGIVTSETLQTNQLYSSIATLDYVTIATGTFFSMSGSDLYVAHGTLGTGSYGALYGTSISSSHAFIDNATIQSGAFTMLTGSNIYASNVITSSGTITSLSSNNIQSSYVSSSSGSIPYLSVSQLEAIGNTLQIASNSNVTTNVNIATSNSIQTVNIGTVGGGQTLINLGGPGDTVNVSGTLVYVDSQVDVLKNPYIILNDGGVNINNCGIIVAKTGPLQSTTGASILVNSDQNAWVLQAGDGPLVTLNQNLALGSNVLFGNMSGTQLQAPSGTITSLSVSSITGSVSNFLTTTTNQLNVATLTGAQGTISTLNVSSITGSSSNFNTTTTNLLNVVTLTGAQGTITTLNVSSITGSSGNFLTTTTNQLNAVTLTGAQGTISTLNVSSITGSSGAFTSATIGKLTVSTGSVSSLSVTNIAATSFTGSQFYAQTGGFDFVSANNEVIQSNLYLATGSRIRSQVPTDTLYVDAHFNAANVFTVNAITGKTSFCNYGAGIMTPTIVYDGPNGTIYATGSTGAGYFKQVGIATTTPSYLLQVGNGGRLAISNGTGSLTIIGTQNNDGPTNTRIVFSEPSRATYGGNIEYVAATGPGGHHIFYKPGQIEAMRITSTGFVGIGTNDPQNALQVYGGAFTGTKEILQLTSYQTVFGINQSSAGILFSTKWSGNGANYNLARIRATDSIAAGGTSGYGDIVFDNFNNFTMTERMRITSAGYVGIGTSNPTQALMIGGGNLQLGTSSSDYRQFIIGGGNSYGYMYGAFAKYGDAVHMGYNYYASGANGYVANVGGATSRISMGYGYISMLCGPVNTEPTNYGVNINTFGQVSIATNSVPSIASQNVNLTIGNSYNGTTTNGGVMALLGANPLITFTAYPAASNTNRPCIILNRPGSAYGAIGVNDSAGTDSGVWMGEYSANASTGGVATLGVFVKNGGNVGIGTSSPSVPLHVYSSNVVTPTIARINNNYAGQNTSGGDYSQAELLLGNASFYNTIRSSIPNGNWGDSCRLDFCTPQAGNNNTQVIRMSVMQFNGYVGIGTTAPAVRLHIAEPSNSTTATYLKVTNSSNQSLGAIFGQDTGNNVLVYNQANANLYFATNNINRWLILNDGTTFQSTGTMILRRQYGYNTSSNGFQNYLTIGEDDGDKNFQVISSYAFRYNNMGGAGTDAIMAISAVYSTSYLGQYTVNGQSYMDMMSFKGTSSSGTFAVGIGTTNPTRRLEVSSSTFDSYLKISSPAAYQKALEFYDITNAAQRWVYYVGGGSDTSIRWYNPTANRDVMILDVNGNLAQYGVHSIINTVDNAYANGLFLIKQRPNGVKDGNELGYVFYEGTDNGATIRVGGYIIMTAAGDWTSSNSSANMNIYSCNYGTITPVIRAQFGYDGRFRVFNPTSTNGAYMILDSTLYSSGGTAWWLGSALSGNGGGSGNFEIYNSGGSKLIMDTTGNVFLSNQVGAATYLRFSSYTTASAGGNPFPYLIMNKGGAWFTMAALNKTSNDGIYIGASTSAGAIYTTCLSMLDNGYVGIGTTSPSQIVNVKRAGSDNYVRIEAGGSSANYSGVWLTEDGNYYGFLSRYDANTDNFSINATSDASTINPRMTITWNGLVGIGTTSPSSSLHVAGQNSTTPSAPGVHIGLDSVNYASVELCVNSISAGAPYIDFTAPGYDYRGRIIYFFPDEAMYFYTYWGNGISRYSVNVMYLTNKLNVPSQDGGGYSAVFAGSIYAVSSSFPSDIRIKTNVTAVPTNMCLDKVMQMDVVTYDYISQQQRQSTGVLGFISQQIQTVDPNCVQLITQCIPNINQVVSLHCVATGPLNSYTYQFSFTGNYTGATTGTIQFMCNGLTVDCEILEYAENSFVVKSQQALEESCYCYGTQVNDFTALDKNRLFAYGIGAIKDLSRELTATKAKYDSLKSVLMEATSFDDLKAKLMLI